MVTPTNHVITQPRFIMRGALGTLEIFKRFLPNIGEYQKVFYHLSTEPLMALCHITVNLALVIALRP